MWKEAVIHNFNAFRDYKETENLSQGHRYPGGVEPATKQACQLICHDDQVTSQKTENSAVIKVKIRERKVRLTVIYITVKTQFYFRLHLMTRMS
jgi:hypothetical protein